MSQESVYNILKRNPERQYTTSEIAKILKISIGAVNLSLAKLSNQNLIVLEYSGNKPHPFKKKTARYNREKDGNAL